MLATVALLCVVALAGVCAWLVVQVRTLRSDLTDLRGRRRTAAALLAEHREQAADGTLPRRRRHLHSVPPLATVGVAGAAVHWVKVHRGEVATAATGTAAFVVLAVVASGTGTDLPRDGPRPDGSYSPPYQSLWVPPAATPDPPATARTRTSPPASPVTVEPEREPATSPRPTHTPTPEPIPATMPARPDVTVAPTPRPPTVEDEPDHRCTIRVRRIVCVVVSFLAHGQYQGSVDGPGEGWLPEAVASPVPRPVG